MIKVLPKELSETMNDCIQIVNVIEAKALNSQISLLLCMKNVLYCTTSSLPHARH